MPRKCSFQGSWHWPQPQSDPPPSIPRVKRRSILALGSVSWGKRAGVSHLPWCPSEVEEAGNRQPHSSSVGLGGKFYTAWTDGINSQKREKLESCAPTGFNLATPQNPCKGLQWCKCAKQTTDWWNWNSRWETQESVLEGSSPDDSDAQAASKGSDIPRHQEPLDVRQEEAIQYHQWNIPARMSNLNPMSKQSDNVSCATFYNTTSLDSSRQSVPVSMTQYLRHRREAILDEKILKRHNNSMHCINLD